MKWVMLAGPLTMAGLVLVDDHIIAQSDRAFHPGEITLAKAKGDSLTFTNQDDFIRQVYLPGLFDSGVRRRAKTYRIFSAHWNL